MYSLFIDTHSFEAVVILYKDGQIISNKIKQSDKSHSAVLMPLIDEIFEESKLDINVLKEIIVVNGPGSFTGIRIGIVVAKTLCYALNIQLKTVDGFEVLLSSSNSINKKQIIIKDPKGYYEALFDESNKLIEDYKYLSSEKFVEKKGFELIDETLEIDYAKVYAFCQSILPLSAHGAKPLYIKKIEVEK